jgi:probable F420-dependent oxidoreductase
MRLGLALPTFGTTVQASAIAAVARCAEEAGYDSLWSGDRVLAPPVTSVPYGGGDGVMPRSYENHLDPLLTLTLAAAHTSRVRLGTSTLNGLWQPPLMLARALTTLDVFSSGRLDVGLGLGWMPEEYAAVGVPWQGRGARLEETLDILHAYWEREVMSHQGPLFTIPETVVGLKPWRRQGPRVLLAAFTPRGLSRIARLADGWLPIAMPLPQLMGLWAGITKEAEATGRDPRSLHMALRVNPELTQERSDGSGEPGDAPGSGTLDQYVDYARAAEQAGVHELFIDFGQTPASLGERIDLAARFIQGVRAG